MNLIKRAMLGTFVLSIRAAERMFRLDKRVWGREHLSRGAKIIAANHITSHDPFHVMPLFREPTHFIIGPGYRSPLVARMLDFFEQINALEGDSDSVVADAAKYLARGEPVCIAPEGDIQEPFRLGRFYPGVARIYRKYPAPIIPMGLVAPKQCLRADPKRSDFINGHEYRFVTAHRGPFCINLGEPWMPDCTGKSDSKALLYIMRGLEERVAALVEEVRQDKFWQ